MPTITKQRPAGSKPRPSSGSILSQAVAVANLERAPLKVLLYGGNRVGKTTLACGFSKPLLLVSFEPAKSGGAESVRRIEGVHIVREGVHFKGLVGAVQLANELKAGSEYRTVVVDSASSLQDLVLREILDLPATPDQMSWGMVSSDQYRQRSEKTREALRPFLDLDVDTIILSKEKDHNPPKEEKYNERTGKTSPDMRPKFLRGLQQESFIAADLGGATVGWLQDCCDCICRLFVEEEVVTTKTVINKKEVTQSRPTGKYIRYLRTSYHPNFAAGVRSCQPEDVPEVIVNPTAAKLIEVIRGKPLK